MRYFYYNGIRVNKHEFINRLLDERNDNKRLYIMFGDREYLEKIECTDRKLKIIFTKEDLM
jgi:hypothetical protein